MSRRPTAKQTVAQEWCTPKRVAASCDFFRTIQDDVVSWWREHKRTDLPWRPPPPPLPPVSSASASRDATTRTPLANPYEVWVSEVMSQQTRMETVIPYFNKWMEKFPSIEALAASSEEEVKAVWAGMGYYRRALYLHKGAQYLLEWTRSQPGHDGALPSAGASMPSTQRELLKVPGIGPYTSAAVASLCFGEAVCSVDGNVVRVLSRLRGERGFDPKIPANVKRADAWGQELMGNTPRTSSVVCRDPSALNQGLMELGASVCKPGGAPLCASCPLQVHCCAYALLRSGEIDAIEGVIPVRAAATAKRTAKEVCVVHEVAGGEDEAAAGAAETRHRRFIVVRRPSAGLLASMLEFPTVVARAQYEDAREASQLLKHPLCALPVPLGHSAPSDVRTCGSIRHIFSHILLDVHVLHVRWPAGIDSSELCHAVAGVIDDHVKCDGEGKVSSAGTRMSLMSEAELRRGAPSRLMLKVLEQVSSSEGKRIRNASPRQQKPPVTSLTAKAAKKRSRS